MFPVEVLLVVLGPGVQTVKQLLHSSPHKLVFIFNASVEEVVPDYSVLDPLEEVSLIKVPDV